MTRQTHLAAGLALGVGLSSIQHLPLLSGLAFALVTEVAAVLPDIDLRLKLKHRGVTHSFLALLLISLGAWAVLPLLLPYVSLGYGSHLLLDLLTVWGIPLLWPLQKRFRLLKLRTGGRVDRLLAVGALGTSLYGLMLMLSRKP